MLMDRPFTAPRAHVCVLLLVRPGVFSRERRRTFGSVGIGGGISIAFSDVAAITFDLLRELCTKNTIPSSDSPFFVVEHVRGILVLNAPGLRAVRPLHSRLPERPRVSVHSGHAPLTAAEVSILCANRDEFLGRPTLPAHFHSFEALSQPASVSVSNADGQAVQQAQGTAPAGSVLSGRDVLAEGTWLGFHRTTGRVALLTNITEPPRVYASSRGTLVASFLGDPSGDLTSEAAALTRQTTLYAGFNLLLLAPLPSSSSASASTLAYDAHLVTNGGGGGPIRSRTLTDAERACGGVSNGVDGQGGDLWPKVAQGRAELGQVLDEELSRGPAAAETDERLAGRLIELLTAHSPIPPPRERAELKNTILVPPFDTGVAKPDAPHAYYGTRLAQVILVRRNGHVTFNEHDVWLLDTTGAPVRAGANNMRTFTFHVGAD